MKYWKTFNKILPLALATAVIMELASCGNSDMEMETAIETEYTAPLSISAVISSGGETRVDGLDAETFEEGDTIGLFVLNSDGSAYDENANSLNAPAVYNGSNWTILEDINLTSETARILSYYPYDESFGNNLPTTTTSSGLSFDLLLQSDILTSNEQNADRDDPSVTLYFSHALSRVTLSIKAADDDDDLVLSSVSIKSDDNDIPDVAWIILGDSLMLQSGSSNTEELTVRLDETQTLSSSNRYDADILLFPCSTSGKSASLMINGISCNVELPSTPTSWESGTKTTYLITVSHAVEDNETILAVVSSSTIYGWEDGGTNEELEATANEVDYNGYEAVDLGLSVKWATCNVGASSPEEYGDYFAWGETEPKDDYSDDNSVTYGVEMDDISGIAEYDAATANWGGSWRMPTLTEIQELLGDCSCEWTTLNDTNGYLITSTNGNSIFLPATGWRDGTSLYDAGGHGSYWSSTPLGSYLQSAYNLYFYSDGHSGNGNYRYYGQSIRPVTE